MGESWEDAAPCPVGAAPGALPAHLAGPRSWGCRMRQGPRWASPAGSSWMAAQARCSETRVSGRQRPRFLPKAARGLSVSPLPVLDGAGSSVGLSVSPQHGPEPPAPQEGPHPRSRTGGAAVPRDGDCSRPRAPCSAVLDPKRPALPPPPCPAALLGGRGVGWGGAGLSLFG